MNKKIKLIWDFRGSKAAKTADPHEKHLKEYIVIKELELNITGHQHLGNLHSLAFMVVHEVNMIAVRDALKPHRGEIYEE